MNLITVLPLALALFASVLALPATVEPPPKDVDFHVFPEAGLDSLEQLAGNGTPDDEDDDYDVEARSPEAAAAGQCTLANLEKIMFDYSELTALNPCCHSPKLTPLPRHVSIPRRPQRQIAQLLQLVLRRMHPQPRPPARFQFHPAMPETLWRYEFRSEWPVEPGQ
jgi:hypothetical protein